MTTEESNTFDFGDGRGPVPARRHGNGGGWVAATAQVDASAYVGPDAWVYGNARVFGNAQVFGNAWVYGNARVFGDARVSDNAQVFGNAEVSGNARVFGNAQVFDDARVSGDLTYLHGRTAGYSWDTYLSEAGIRILRYGCECHPLSWWEQQDSSLSLEHGEEEEHWAHVQRVIAIANLLPSGETNE